MFLKTVLIAFLPKYMMSPILSPKINDVLINSSLELTCDAPNNVTVTKWGTLNQAKSFSLLKYIQEGICSTNSFLADNQYFETRCYSNATFKVKIKRVNISNHDQKWYCSLPYDQSNTASINVQVPTEYVTFKNISGGSLKTIEKKKTTLICETSEGRPAANITWTKISKKGIRIDLTNDKKYNISNIKKLSNGSMTIVTSSIGIEPVRDDDGARIICEATNTKESRNATKEIKIHVQFPPSRPTFFVNGSKVNDSVRVIIGKNVSVSCMSDSNPYPSYRWNSSRKLEDSQYLNLSTLNKNGTWQCTATNEMILPNKIIPGKNCATLEVDMLCIPFASPEFDLKTNVSSAQNMTITFQFKAIAYPIPEFHWSKLIGSSWNSLKNCKKCKIKTVDKHSNLTIKSITKEDYGHYKLRIENDVGSFEQRYFLKTNGKPDRPSIFEHLNEYVTETSAILRWKPGFDGGFEQTFILRYKLYSGNDWLNVSLLDFGGKTMNYTLSGLKGGSVYSTELYAVNTQGKSMPLNLTFKTRSNCIKQRDCPSLSDNLERDWIYITLTIGGIILVVVVLFIVIKLTRRRLKQQSADTAFRQNAPFSVSENCHIYQNFPLNAQTANQNVFPSNAEVKKSQSVTERPQDNKISQNQQVIVLDDEEPYPEASDYYNILEIISRLEKINVTELYDYVTDRTDKLFSVDFQKIPTGFQMPCSFARKPKNIAFNRYRGILPYDHTRVYIDDQPDFFINASYIDGYMKQKVYIACSGPTAATHDNFKTFWKMVWHEKSELIVMVTNLNELSGMKCEKYWPDPSQDEMYGDILVSCQKIEIFAEYIIRGFEVTRTTNAGTFCRRLVHLHYTAWPDKKTPEDVMTLLDFRQIFLGIRTTVNGPVVIHCSAGIGRTGVFIAIDRLITEGVNEGSVNVIACITKMREQRVKMVQTSEQFKFIFQALAYALNFDWGPIPIESLKDHNTIDDEFLDRQYKELESSLEMESREQIDSRANNKSYKDKNRQRADIPDNTNRVYLYLNRSYEDSDYINAVFINSYRCKDHFIMAQSPLPGTESDFLTMIYQENCFCVVSMEDLNDQEMKIGKHYLGEKESLNIGSLTVSCVINDSKPQYTVRKVTMTNKDEDFYYLLSN